MKNLTWVIGFVVMAVGLVCGGCCGGGSCPFFGGDKTVELFNGKDLSGWQIVSAEKEKDWGTGGAGADWVVKDGILTAEGDQASWLATEEKYGNFELELEFRVFEGGNSGVFLRAPLKGNPAYDGMEVQILDDYAAGYADLKPWQYAGSVYALQAPSEQVTKPAGQWQKMLIICNGRNVKVTYNDTGIIDLNLDDHLDKLPDHPGVGMPDGHIGLQHHGTGVEYRKVSLKPLP